MKTVKELNKREFNEVKLHFFSHLLKVIPELNNIADLWHKIPDEFVTAFYDGYTFDEKEFYCNHLNI